MAMSSATRTWLKAVLLSIFIALASASFAAEVPRAGSPPAEYYSDMGMQGQSTPLRDSLTRSLSPPELSPTGSISPSTITLESYKSPAYARDQNWRFDLKSVVTFQHQQMRTAARHACPSCERSQSVDPDGIGEVQLRKNVHTVTV